MIPNTVAVNVATPMPAGGIHVDVPSFRGADRGLTAVLVDVCFLL
jgi:hypothetical protein